MRTRCCSQYGMGIQIHEDKMLQSIWDGNTNTIDKSYISIVDILMLHVVERNVLHAEYS